jgi:glycosyltransferase involved in cell wall biosynthesis
MAVVSLICTIRNEVKTIGALIESMARQTRPPDEIVIADAASTDGTQAVIESYIARGYPLKLVDGRGNISAGRNKAIAHARGEIIVSADAGLTLSENWIEALIAPIEAGEADVTGGASRPLPRSLFEAIVGEMLYLKPEYAAMRALIGKWHWPTRNGLAFYRSDWKAVGGFPEWLDHNEDVIFAKSLLAQNKRFKFVPEAIVSFRPRESLRALYRQHYLYARGDGMAGTKTGVYAIRVAAGLGALGAPFVLLRNARQRRVWLGLLGGGAGWLGYQRYRLHRAFNGRPTNEQLAGLVLVPLVRLTYEYARLFGATAGRLERRRRRQPE